MKTLLLVLFCLCLNLKGQTPCGDSSGHWSLIQTNTTITYVYEVGKQDSNAISADSLFKLVYSHCLKIHGYSGSTTTGKTISVVLKNVSMDYKKYGGRWANTPILLTHPIDLNVTIDVKNGKYRVIISNMHSKIKGMYNSETDFDWNFNIYNRKGCVKDPWGTMPDIFEFMDKYWYEQFELNPEDANSNW